MGGMKTSAESEGNGKFVVCEVSAVDGRVRKRLEMGEACDVRDSRGAGGVQGIKKGVGCMYIPVINISRTR